MASPACHGPSQQEECCTQLAGLLRVRYQVIVHARETFASVFDFRMSKSQEKRLRFPLCPVLAAKIPGICILSGDLARDQVPKGQQGQSLLGSLL